MSADIVFGEGGDRGCGGGGWGGVVDEAVRVYQ